MSTFRHTGFSPFIQYYFFWCGFLGVNLLTKSIGKIVSFLIHIYHPLLEISNPFGRQYIIVLGNLCDLAEPQFSH